MAGKPDGSGATDRTVHDSPVVELWKAIRPDRGCERSGVMTNRVNSLLGFGSACWARTSDPLINSQLLYQLS